ncbi:NAD(P)/FAD-dependent oxidoreductase [Nocardioides coralli]|uniref:NAD(P)/FAD-dependent oxidoreductase n=1 Tax=Nocardioides coralli TaxID=2872154 RepID=UPI001CA3DADE|nr:FAD-binding oxidoreductase [Nocardioides coralli]QZY28106.1 FAD-binding oxidoreductase [Nocardioides coralli]
MGRSLSPSRALWADTADPGPHCPPLTGDLAVDVAIVGGGFTGLWTAHYLAEADPSLRIAVLEAETVGYGASGRNGGWCSALFPAGPGTLARMGEGTAAAAAQHAAMRESVTEVGRAAEALAIDAHYARGGTISLARSPAQLARARAEVEEARRWGRDEDDLRLLGAEEARSVVDATGVLGATYSPDCAAVHPLRLVRGLAASVAGRGVRVHEHTRVTTLAPHRLTTPSGTVTAETVVRATEGYTSQLPGLRRALVPVYSLVIATEPLPPTTWERIGLRRRETFADHRHLIVYGQRTRDDRLVFGGRGAPYHLGSRVSASYDRDDRVFAMLHASLVEMLPVVAGARITHAWGGPLGVPRDWCASVGLDPVTRVAWAGGYVGDGVSTANLAGRTLRDLVLDRRTPLTDLPWVGHRSPAWEPEPLRWLGINAARVAMGWADTEERFTGRPSLVARALSPLVS